MAKTLWVQYAGTTCEEGLQHVKHSTQHQHHKKHIFGLGHSRGYSAIPVPLLLEISTEAILFQMRSQRRIL